MNWDNFDHWRDRQFDLFTWYRGMTLREMERELNVGFREFYNGQDFIRIHLNGEWPNEEV